MQCVGLNILKSSSGQFTHNPKIQESIIYLFMAKMHIMKIQDVELHIFKIQKVKCIQSIIQDKLQPTKKKNKKSKKKEKNREAATMSFHSWCNFFLLLSFCSKTSRAPCPRFTPVRLPPFPYSPSQKKGPMAPRVEILFVVLFATKSHPNFTLFPIIYFPRKTIQIICDICSVCNVITHIFII